MHFRLDQVLADGDYELVPAQAEGGSEAELNAVHAESTEGPAEEPATNIGSEGKPRSMTYV